jgi:hypothetical protein
MREFGKRCLNTLPSLGNPVRVRLTAGERYDSTRAVQMSEGFAVSLSLQIEATQAKISSTLSLRRVLERSFHLTNLASSLASTTPGCIVSAIW